jgi:hypothetical protein
LRKRTRKRRGEDKKDTLKEDGNAKEEDKDKEEDKNQDKEKE